MITISTVAYQQIFDCSSLVWPTQIASIIWDSKGPIPPGFLNVLQSLESVQTQMEFREKCDPTEICTSKW